MASMGVDSSSLGGCQARRARAKRAAWRGDALCSGARGGVVSRRASRARALQIFVTLRTGKAYPPKTVDVRCAAQPRCR